MNIRIGVIYSSVDGQTIKICREIALLFRRNQISTELYSIDSFTENLLDFDVIIIGASIRYGKHKSNIVEFVKENIDSLNKTTTAFFSVNLVARKENKNLPSTNPYLMKFLKDTQWSPDFVNVFAGKLDYASYSICDRLMIKLIMKLTDGPVKSNGPIEFTKWDQVQGFALEIINNLKSKS